MSSKATLSLSAPCNASNNIVTEDFHQQPLFPLIWFLTKTRKQHRRCSIKNIFFKILQYFEKKYLPWSPCFIKAVGLGLNLYQTKDYMAGVFQFFQRNVPEHLLIEHPRIAASTILPLLHVILFIDIEKATDYRVKMKARVQIQISFKIVNTLYHHLTL